MMLEDLERKFTKSVIMHLRPDLSDETFLEGPGRDTGWVELLYAAENFFSLLVRYFQPKTQIEVLYNEVQLPAQIPVLVDVSNDLFRQEDVKIVNFLHAELGKQLF